MILTVSLNMDDTTIEIKNPISSEWMAGHRFTDAAHRIIRDSLSRGSDRGFFGKFPTLLIFWAMLRWERKVGIMALEACDIDLAQLERDVVLEFRTFAKGSVRDGVDLIHLKTIAEQAVKEAALLGHNYVGSEHLTLALCRDQNEAVQRLFKKHGV